MRKNNQVHDVRPHLNLSSSSSTSGIVDLEFNSSNVLVFNGRTIPQINYPTGDSDSQTSQSEDGNTTGNYDFMKLLCVEPNVKERMEETKTDSFGPLGHVSNEGKVLRRPSYTTAIDNETRSVEDVHIPRSRSYSFQTAIEQGQISPTGPPQMISSSSVGDTTTENESSEQSWNSVPPRFSSTPLLQQKPPTKSVVFHPHTVKPYSNSKNKSVPVSEVRDHISDIDRVGITEHREADRGGEILKQSQDKDPSRSITMSMQAELLKTGQVNENMSPCTSKNLSILLEEDARGASDSSSQASPSLSATGMHPTQHVSSFLGSEPLSTEFWTLSRSSNRQTDSGHSSSLTSSSSFQHKKEKDIVDISNVHSKSEISSIGSGVSSSLSPKGSKSPKQTNSVQSSKLVNASQSSPPRTSISDTHMSPSRLQMSPTASKNTDSVSSKPPKRVIDTTTSRQSEINGQSEVVSASKSLKQVVSSSSCVSSKSLDIPRVATSKSVPTNSVKLPVAETVISSEASDLLESSDQDKSGMIISTAQCLSTLKEGDSENISDLANSLSCLSLNTSPKCTLNTGKGKDSSSIKAGPFENKKLKKTQNIPSVTITSTASLLKCELNNPNSGKEAQSSSQSFKGGGEANFKDALWDMKEMVKDSPPTSNSISAASSCSSKLSSLDSRMSSFSSKLSSMDSRMSSTSSSDAASAFASSSSFRPGRQSQMIIEDDEDYAFKDEQKVETNLSKLRESHLARRRDQLRSRMPQLSELAEKDGGALQNGHGEGEEKLEVIRPPSPSDDPVMPSVPDEFLSKLGLTQDDPSSEELSDQEIESKFTSLSLAFKTDSQTLEKRLEIQERSRDIAEQNVDKELQGLRTGLATLNQICTDPQVREVLTKIQNHIDVLEKATARVSSRAEVLGAIQQEKRMSKAVDIMVHHVENLRRVHEREHAELEEAKKLLQDSRSLGPSTIDLTGTERMLSRRSASVCPNNMLPGQSSRRRVSEIALPKVLGGSGATLHLSSSMDLPISPDSKSQHSPSSLRMENSLDEEEDARTRFQAAVASTAVKSTVANTLRRASLERQNPVQQSSTSTPDLSRDNSQDKKIEERVVDVQDKEKQKNMEEEAFKKGYEQGMRASLGQDLSGLREQQNQINQSLGDMMDSIDSQMEEPKSLKEVLMIRADSLVPKVKISGWRIRMTFGCFFIVMAIISVIVSLFPVGSASLIGFRHYGRPPL